MISNKKSYAMKMLHLALALSLLHVDPDYLLGRWDRESQLELSHYGGDGNWELEMLRTVPMIETQHPYGNRKDIHPPIRIEDFLPFYEIGSNDGRGSGEGKLPTIFNASALVMNLHNTTGNSSIQTTALQDMQSNPTGGASGNSVVGGSSASAGGGVGVPGTGSTSGSTLGELHIDTASLSTGHNHSYNLLAGGSSFGELPSFPTSTNQETRSILEQNLADLLDFNDLPPLATPYANLPLKDGQQQSPNSTHLDLNLAALLHGFAGGLTSLEDANALNDSTPHPSNVGSSIVEQFGPDGNDEDDDLLLNRLFRETSDDANDENDNDDNEVNRAIGSGIANACAVEGLTTNEPFINEVEVAVDIKEEVVEEEESEIAEVLYKQDVDLGFSLDQEKIINASFASGNSAASDAAKANALVDGKPSSGDPLTTSQDADKSKNDNDDIEKLKALEELQQEDMNKVNEKDANDLNDITNEWNGIPFTIDNETGEYIRLPLDELLNDVLKLSEFPLEDELPDDSIASTSQAAAAAALNGGNQGQKSQKQRIVSETGEELLDDSGNVVVPSKQQRNSSNTNDPTTSDIGDENSFSVSDFEDLQNSVGSPLFDLDEDAKKELDEMLQSTASPYHHPHGHHHAGHPHPHAHHHHAHAHHAAAAAAAHQRAVQANYPSVSVGSGTASAFQRQPTAGGFHHGHHQSRMPRLNRSVSMERLQDFATYFSPIPNMDMAPYPHYPSYSYQSPTSGAPTAQHPSTQYGHGGALQPPPPPPPPHHHHGHHAAAAAAMLHPTSTLGDICSSATGQPHYGHNLGSAVSSSMHLTNSSHEADAGAAAAAAVAGNAYKMEHDIMYYGNASSDINQTDGFMNSIFTDEDLHLMDMNESFCRMVDNSTSNNSSVLGLPSGGGHGSTALAAGGNHPNGANAGTVGGVASMSAGGSVVGATGMTADLLASGGGAGAQGGSGDRLDSSSDSAVSSMGSERVPSLSDGEWGEGSDSAQDYHQGKYGGPYDFSYNNTRISTATRQPPVAQKKHQLYGKRDPHKQTPSALPPTAPPAAPTTAQNIKYEYDAGYAGMTNAGPGAAGLQHNSGEAGAMGPALSKEFHHQQPYGMGGSNSFSGDYTSRPSPRTSQDIVQLNHTYSLPQGSGSLPRPQARDKKTMPATKNMSKGAAAAASSAISEEEHLTRDEKRARSINIPIPVTEIINLPMDEFNERLSKYDLNENQLSLIRDIRRRGKNKVAAQNCRKRKLDQILTLEDEVHAVVKRKSQLNNDREQLDAERKRISNKFAMLHRHVFQYLRDPEGNPCSPADYSLQQAADGSVYLLPRDKTDSNSTTTSASSSVSATGGPATASSGSGLNGHVPSQAPLHSHGQHHQGQVQHVANGGPMSQQQQSRLPPHLQQQQAPHHHHLHQQQQQQAHPQQQGQQQQHHKE
ncbi:segmentation protein cap'n'collar isoform X1 [Drosophila tropicalis]|uniref:segmentation protein cap'n'collar isoform X1 n=1 Tax=Drosophila tropicalis TaxID=46794 RepID=UPI0035AB84BC